MIATTFSWAPHNFFLLQKQNLRAYSYPPLFQPILQYSSLEIPFAWKWKIVRQQNSQKWICLAVRGGFDLPVGVDLFGTRTRICRNNRKDESGNNYHLHLRARSRKSGRKGEARRRNGRKNVIFCSSETFNFSQKYSWLFFFIGHMIRSPTIANTVF